VRRLDAASNKVSRAAYKSRTHMSCVIVVQPGRTQQAVVHVRCVQAATRCAGCANPCGFANSPRNQVLERISTEWVTAGSPKTGQKVAIVRLGDLHSDPTKRRHRYWWQLPSRRSLPCLDMHMVRVGGVAR
jgi:hypothetical protein